MTGPAMAVEEFARRALTGEDFALSPIELGSILLGLAPDEPPAWHGFMARTATILRRLHAAQKDPGVGYRVVDDFREYFVPERDWPAVPELDAAFGDLAGFYERMELFSASALDRQDNPYIIGVEELRAVVGEVHRVLGGAWKRALHNAVAREDGHKAP